jgi:iron complex transport system substrate-binding protein
MKLFLLKSILLFSFLYFIQCKKYEEKSESKNNISNNSVRYAKGFSLNKHKGFSIIKISNPWPNANKKYTFVLQEKNGIIPDSLNEFPVIQVPIKTIITTSTTHITSLEMLGVEKSLIGFPHLDFISSDKVRARIEAKKIKEIGQKDDLNTEIILDLSPSVIVGFGIDNNNPTYNNLEKSGLKVVFNGDWNEQSPLGKAEWIKFFGALYHLDQKADSIFNEIEKNYNSTLKLALNAKTKPSVLCGEMYENVWYLPQGNSWNALFLKDAKANYLWANSNGSGSLALPFESVLEKAQTASFWIQGTYNSLAEMQNANIHYNQFAAFQNKNVYSFGKKGKTGGVIYYELAPNRPDLVLKDLLKIMHPELLIDYNLYFYKKLD